MSSLALVQEAVPLMNRAARGDLRTKAAGVTRAEIDLRAMETALAGQVARLVRELETSQRRLELAELNLRLAEETLLAEKALQATQWEQAYFDTLQKRLLKVGARVEELRTKVKFHFPSSFPLKQVYGYMLARLQAAWT